jgi:hypothetical protein
MINIIRRKDREEAIVYIYESEVASIVAEAQRFPSSETGGDLYGTFTHGNLPIVWLSSGPGPYAKHNTNHFEQDTIFINYWQNRLMKEFGLQYLGAWHSHHVLDLLQPSHGDVESARKYALKHNRRRALEIIVNHERGNTSDTVLRPYFYPNAAETGWIPTRFNALKGYSPIRERLGPDITKFSRSWNEAQTYTNIFSNLVSSDSKSNAFGIPYSDEPNIYPSDLLKAINIIETENVEIEQRNNYIMVLIPLSEDKSLAFAIQDSNGLNIVQVRIIDHCIKSSRNITELLRERGVLLTIDRKNVVVLRNIHNMVMQKI